LNWYVYNKTRSEPGPITVDLTTTVVNSYKLLINDVKPVHSLDSRDYVTVTSSWSSSRDLASKQGEGTTTLKLPELVSID